MPPKGNYRQGESDPGEHGEHSVRDGHGSSVGDVFGMWGLRRMIWVYIRRRSSGGYITRGPV